MAIDYLATAKDTIAQANGEHPIEHVKTWALVALASAVIDIAENVRSLVAAASRYTIGGAK